MSGPFTPLERDIQKTIVAVAASRGVTLHRRNIMAMTGEHNGKRWHVANGKPGQSDLWGTLPNGVHLEVEVKRKGKRPTPKQLAWLIEMNETGISCWADNATTFGRVLDAILRGGRVVYHGDKGDYDLEV